MRSPSNPDGQEVVAYQARLDDEKEHNVATSWSRPRRLVNFCDSGSNIKCGETRKKHVACEARYMDAHNPEQPTLRIHRYMRERSIAVPILEVMTIWQYRCYAHLAVRSPSLHLSPPLAYQRRLHLLFGSDHAFSVVSERVCGVGGQEL